MARPRGSRLPAHLVLAAVAKAERDGRLVRDLPVLTPPDLCTGYVDRAGTPQDLLAAKVLGRLVRWVTSANNASGASEDAGGLALTTNAPKAEQAGAKHHGRPRLAAASSRSASATMAGVTHGRGRKSAEVHEGAATSER